MTESSLIDRLLALPTTEPVPREEWEWLVEHGQFESFAAGQLFAPPGDRIDRAWILLTGRITVSVTKGGGERRVAEWRAGDVSGRLPYSRMGVTRPERVIRTEEPTECLAIYEQHFPEMVARCPAFTAWCVHGMLDRARMFNSADLQDEKMLSLGKLAAGLAHELNNPASATARAAKQLMAGLVEAESAARALGAAGADAAAMAAIERLRTVCLGAASGTVLSPLQQADREEAIADWLGRHGLDTGLAPAIADTAATLEELDRLAAGVSEGVLHAAVRWVAAGCATQALAADIEQSAARIAELVAAVKRFTYMDTAVGPERIDVVPGLRDTIRMLAAKARGRGVGVALNVADGVPPVLASGGELNQVWMNLIDNALDATPAGGSVAVEVRQELDRVVVRVIDDGSGVPEELVSRIFDPFMTTKPPGQGTGLGLEIARKLVQRYRGELVLEPDQARTTFAVRLPAAEPEVAA